MKSIFILLVLISFISCNNTSYNSPEIAKQVNEVREYFTPLEQPVEGTWRYLHPEEKQQSLSNYIRLKPASITSERNVIYIVPIGEFSKAQENIITETCIYIETFFGLKTHLALYEKTPNVPDNMRRLRVDEYQYNAHYFLDEYLDIDKYKDASVMIALTSFDLYPDETWNYVFGLASLQKRVGVWSMARFGNPSENQKSYQLCLDRTRKVATHEIAHMFSIKHCCTYPCVMNGSNSMSETDAQPFVLCPECLEKLCWNFKTTPNAISKNLLEYWKSQKDSNYVNLYNEFVKSTQ